MATTYRMSEAATKDGLPRSSFAYTPSDNPSDWKLPYLTASGAPDPAHLPGAAAALSSGGFRGKKADIPSSALPVVKAKLRQAYRRWGKGEEMPDSIRESGALIERTWDEAVATVEAGFAEDTDDALRLTMAMREYVREAGDDDDHFYGAWKRGGRMSGGAMAKARASQRRKARKQAAKKSEKAPSLRDMTTEELARLSTSRSFGVEREAVQDELRRRRRATRASAARAAKKADLDRTNETIARQEAEFKMAVAGNKDTWVPGAGGKEMPVLKGGQRVQRVFNPKTRKHGWLDMGSDIVYPDDNLPKWLR